MCMNVLPACMCVDYSSCGGQRTIYRRWFCPPTIWILWIGLRLGSKHLYPLIHLIYWPKKMFYKYYLFGEWSMPAILALGKMVVLKLVWATQQDSQKICMYLHQSGSMTLQCLSHWKISQGGPHHFHPLGELTWIEAKLLLPPPTISSSFLWRKRCRMLDIRHAYLTRSCQKLTKCIWF